MCIIMTQFTENQKLTRRKSLLQKCFFCTHYGSFFHVLMKWQMANGPTERRQNNGETCVIYFSG